MLAKALHDHNDEVVCDLAETYHIFDFEEIKGRRLATLVCGLRPSSRLIMKLSGQKYPMNECLQAMTVDVLNMLLWTKSKDAQSGRNKPQLIINGFLEPKEEGYTSTEDFERARQQIIERTQNG